MAISPPSGRIEMPYFTAFSTSVCSSIGGIGSCSVSGATSSRSRSRSTALFPESARKSDDFVQAGICSDGITSGVFHFSDAANQWSLVKNGFEGFKSKTTNSVNVSATQLLSQNDIILGGISYTRQSGFLGGTRNTVSTGPVTSDRANEILPQGRDKFTANTRYVRSLGQNLAFHLDYRYYTDSWNIRAHTWEPSLAMSFTDEKGVFRVLYRRYSQTAAKYYAAGFSGARGVRTSDSDLAGFTANEGGAQFSYAFEPGEEGGIDWSWGGTAIYYKRSNDLQALIFQLALNAKF